MGQYSYVTCWWLQYDRTALMYAANAGQVAVVDLLLSQGADPNSIDKVSEVFLVTLYNMSVICWLC